MSTTILMPALSPTMEEGTLAKWHVSEGSAVEPGDLLADIETDKAVIEFEAVDPGVIGKLLITEGSPPVSVNSPIAVLLDEGESLPDDVETLIASPDDSESSVQHLEANSRHTEANAGKSEQQDDRVFPSAPPDQISPSTVNKNHSPRIFASPLARRLAAQNQIDLNALQGSGPHGRIIKSDIEEALERGISKPAPAPIAPPSGTPDTAQFYVGRQYKEVQLDGMRRTVAARLTEASQTIPHFYLRRDIEIDSLLAVRQEANGILAADNEKLSINDFIIRACALALQKVPEANTVWAGDRMFQMEASDVAVAVAIEGGLFTPVLRDAETKSVRELSMEMKDLAKRAHSRKLMPQDYTGGSFSISNLGMFGIKNFDAVINPPHSSILAVGTTERKPTEAQDGGLRFVTAMSVTLSCDHRVIDGAAGAKFLSAIADYLEKPVSMLV